MRKFIVVGVLIVAILAVSAASILAQDATSTPLPVSPEATTEATTEPTQAPRGWLGIAVIEHENQVIIARVQAGSPANAADLLIGDVIVSYNGTAIDTAQTLIDQLKDAVPGDKVTLGLLRNGESVTADVTLGPSPASIMGMVGRPNGPFGGRDMNLGMLASRLLGVEVNETDAGYEVTSVDANRNPFSLQEGDVINTLNGQNIKDLDLRTLMEGMAGMDSPKLTLGITRDGKSVDVEIDASDLRGFGRGFGGRPFGNGQGMPPFGNRGNRGNDNNNSDTQNGNGQGVDDNSGLTLSGQV